MKVLSVFGTRPEAIKMAPVLRALSDAKDLESRVCITGQHREMLDQVLELFQVTPDHDLEVMRAAQSLTHITSAVLTGMEAVLTEEQPDWVLVHGDTTTTMAAALAAYYQRVPVGHVEAGLRTGNIYSPWPEEMNRLIATRVASANFAPTESARVNLEREGVDSSTVLVTGNTVVDALYWVRDNALEGPQSSTIESSFPFLDEGKRLILVTGHRRENLDGGLEDMCTALATLARRGDVQIVYPVHLNPMVQETAQRVLGNLEDVYLIPPQDYLPFVWLMNRATLIISDSGGVQEEAPALGVPVLVTRETTERPEAVTAGIVELVGTDVDRIVTSATSLLDDATRYTAMSNATSPYGDGNAAGRIVDYLFETRR